MDSTARVNYEIPYIVTSVLELLKIAELKRNLLDKSTE